MNCLFCKKFCYVNITDNIFKICYNCRCMFYIPISIKSVIEIVIPELNKYNLFYHIDKNMLGIYINHNMDNIKFNINFNNLNIKNFIKKVNQQINIV